MCSSQQTRFEIAVLKSTRSVSSSAERSRLWMPVTGEVEVTMDHVKNNTFDLTFEIQRYYERIRRRGHGHPNSL